VEIEEHAIIHDIIKSFITFYFDDFWKIAKRYLAEEGWKRLLEYEPLFIRQEYGAFYPLVDVLIILYKKHEKYENKPVFLVLPIGIEIKTGKLDPKIYEEQIMKEVRTMDEFSISGGRKNIEKYLSRQLEVRAFIDNITSVGYVLIGKRKYMQNTLEFFEEKRKIKTPEYRISGKIHTGYIPLEDVYLMVKQKLPEILAKFETEG